MRKDLTSLLLLAASLPLSRAFSSIPQIQPVATRLWSTPPGPSGQPGGIDDDEISNHQSNHAILKAFRHDSGIERVLNGDQAQDNSSNNIFVAAVNAEETRELTGCNRDINVHDEESNGKDGKDPVAPPSFAEFISKVVHHG